MVQSAKLSPSPTFQFNRIIEHRKLSLSFTWLCRTIMKQRNGMKIRFKVIVEVP